MDVRNAFVTFSVSLVTDPLTPSSIKCSGILRPDRPKTVLTTLKCSGEHDLFRDAKPNMLASRIVPIRRFASRTKCSGGPRI